MFGNTRSGNGMNINDGSCSSDEAQHAKSTPYPLTTRVSGLTGVVQDVNVTLTSYSHLAPVDVRMLLVGPQGQSTLLMHENGSTDEVWYITLTFDDAAAQPPPTDEYLAGGTYKPSDRSEGWTGCHVFSATGSFPAPAPAGPYGSTLSDFSGTDPNGDWTLYVVDTYQGDWGSLGSWSLDITTTASADHT
jgi:Proprotein convertase P-domain